MRERTLIGLVVLATVSVVALIRCTGPSRPFISANSDPALAPPRPEDQIGILVVNSRNACVPNAHVQVVEDGAALELLIADHSGAVRLRRDYLERHGKVELRCSFGPLKSTVPLTAPVPRAIMVHLPESFALKGRLVSRSRGQPVSGAVIRSGDGAVFTAEDGTFRLAVVPPRHCLDGSVALRVRAPGGTTVPIQLHWEQAIQDPVRLEID